MKLKVNVNNAIIENSGKTGEFRIRQSAKAFSILSSSLYSNKIRAIIRELSTNAYDSHVAAGYPEKQFEVHLPTILEPYFSVKDFGIGLSDKQVIDIYTTYFESTKTESDAYVGALGLGSKSPFSYTENFTVTAIKNKVKRIYSAFINDKGVPSITEMSSEKTKESNGVEVKFSVVNRNDYNSFQNEARYVFSWFKIKPIITGIDRFTLHDVRYLEKDIIPGVHLNSDYYAGTMAVMGNIAYPLNKMPDTQNTLGNLAYLLNCNLVLEFDIGELDFAASREELSYVPQTIDAIKNKLTKLNNSLVSHVKDKAEKIDCFWARAEYLAQQYQINLYKAAVDTYVKDSKFPLCDTTSYTRQKTFSWWEDDLKQKNIGIKIFRRSGSYLNPGLIMQNSKVYNHTSRQYDKQYNILVDTKTHFVIDDLKNGAITRVRHHYSNCNHTVVLISSDEIDLIKKVKICNDFLKGIYNPPIIVNASTLDKKVVTKQATVVTGILSLNLKNSYCSESYYDNYVWRAVNIDTNDNSIYYYVPMSNFDALDEAGNIFEITHLKASMMSCGVNSIKNINIYGVRKNSIKEIEKLSNWKLLLPKVKEELSKVPQDSIKLNLFAEVIDSNNYNVYNSKRLLTMIDNSSDYKKFMNQYTKMKNNTEYSHLKQLFNMFGIKNELESMKKEIEKEAKSIIEKYPMLQYINYGEHEVKDKIIAEYIKMIDKI